MKSLLPILLCGVVFGACQCQPDTPSPVTFRIKNVAGSPIFVDATDGRMGLHVKRNVFGEWIPFVEQPACECQVCESICGCTCDEAPRESRVMKIDEGASAERAWEGRVQVSGSEACGAPLEPPVPCLHQEIPQRNETFRLELCYAPSSQGANDADAGVEVPGALQAESILCVEKPFKIEDGEVEISPERGAECVDHADCKNTDELCFGGACTTACPATGYPALGGGWRVSVPEPDDRGFFTYTGGAGRQGWDGTGRVGSVTYSNDTMTVHLRPNFAGSKSNGSITVTLPPGVAVPLQQDELVSVHIVDLSTNENPENRALTLRDDDGTLLLAVDAAQQGVILKGLELAPFAISREGRIEGCEHTECGKNLFHKTRFAVINEAVEIEPGKSVNLVADGVAWTVTNVGNQVYAAETFCTFSDLQPYVIVNQRAGP